MFEMKATDVTFSVSISPRPSLFNRFTAQGNEHFTFQLCVNLNI